MKKKSLQFFRNPLFILAVLFILTRVFYTAVGVVFDGRVFEHGWYIIDLVQLKTNLLQSMLYLHVSPPMQNILIALVLKIFPQQSEIVFHLFYLITGFVGVLVLYTLMRKLRISPFLSFIFALLYLISPTMILYENWLQFTYIVTALHGLSLLFLYQFLETKKLAYGIAFFGCMTYLALLRSTYQIVWYIAIILLLFLFAKNQRRMFLIAASLPFIILFAWYLKNLILFDTFTSSTWLGMHWSKTTVHMIPEGVRKELVAKGELDPIALIYPFQHIEAYQQFIDPVSNTGIPVLDQKTNTFGEPNYNQLAYMQVSDLYLQESLKVIRKFPQAYKAGLILAWEIYFRSPTEFLFVSDNREKIAGWVNLFNRVVYGVPGEGIYQILPGDFLDFVDLSQIGIFSVLSVLFSFGLGLYIFIKLVIERNKAPEPAMLVLFIACVNIVYVSLVSNSFDVAENNRYRVELELLIFVVTAWFYQEVYNFFRRIIKKSENLADKKQV